MESVYPALAVLLLAIAAFIRSETERRRMLRRTGEALRRAHDAQRAVGAIHREGDELEADVSDV